MLIKEWLFIVIKSRVSFFDILKLLFTRYISRSKNLYFQGVKFTDFDNVLYTTIKEVFLKKDYTPKGFEILPGYVVVDVGAHKGVFTAYASKGDVARIYSFEPDPDNYKSLKTLIETNKFKNVEIVNKAISSKNGELKMLKANKSNQNSVVLERKDILNKCQYEIVTAVNINDALKSLLFVDLLKMDIEGAEYSVIETCSDATFSKIKKLVLEYHRFGNKSEKTLYRILKNKYKEVKVLPPRGNKFGYIYCKDPK